MIIYIILNLKNNFIIDLNKNYNKSLTNTFVNVII